ncbi:MAG: lysylphosphatidylglycerol synthase domain-containing protein [Micrococcales bacterium]|nr:lysylphosphatidylglycerol synthase domain-containing protein [Micrococcales bacterium]
MTEQPRNEATRAEAGGAPGPWAAPRFQVPATPRAIGRRVLQITASLGLAAALLGWGLPYLTHTSWETIIGIVTGIGWPTFFVLLGLMFLGLYAYTFTLTGSLPGLRHSQALLANLAGSAVSNVLPGGGAVGAVLTYGMFRSWRFSHRRIGTSIVVTSVWNILARVLLPVLAALVLIPETEKVPAAMIKGAIVGGAGAGLVAAALLAVIASRRAARWVGHMVNRVIGPMQRARRETQPRQDIAELALDLRDKTLDIARHRWLPLSFGIVGFMGIYFILFRQCLEAVGAHMSWGHAFAAYAVGRLLTAVSVTPGGIGVAEAGAAAVMLALGVPGDVTAAAVTLFALFSFLLEIPFGAVSAIVWMATRERYLRLGPPGQG